MKKLIILNYQREIPPFMQTVIKYGKDIYSDIYYITPRLYHNNTDTVNYDNVHIIQSTLWIRYLCLFRLFFLFFDKETIDIIKRGIKARVSFFAMLKHCAAYLFTSCKLKYLTNRLLRRLGEDDEQIVILASWFASEAYAASLIKKKHQSMKVVSYAHSFEINPAVTPFVLLNYNKTKHLYLDGIYFISDKMRNIYKEALGETYRDISDKCFVSYLGSTKNELSIINKKTVGFNICTCSSVVPVKRLHLLVKALKKWDIDKLTWTHIGDGPLMLELKDMVADLVNSNSHVKVVLFGALHNEQVKEYYKNNSVDLFVNVSQSEGLPVSIMEAISYGIPVLASDVGGTSEIVQATNGFLFPVDASSDKICDMIKEFYYLTDYEKEEYRKQSFNLWKSKFDASKNIVSFLSSL